MKSTITSLLLLAIASLFPSNVEARRPGPSTGPAFTKAATPVYGTAREGESLPDFCYRWNTTVKFVMAYNTADKFVRIPPRWVKNKYGRKYLIPASVGIKFDQPLVIGFE
jgi:hypothetical protein